jgi:hypothetical protein
MKTLNLFSLFLLLPFITQAQTKDDIFNPKVPVVFLGEDFTRIEFTKSDEFINKPQILGFFVDCNNLLKPRVIENAIANKLKRDEIKFDYTYVTRNNALVDWQKVYSDDTEYGLSQEVIKEMIRNLDPDKEKYKDHIGLVFCEENYCKTKPLGTVAIVFFRVNDLEPLLIRHFSEKPSGFGFLNYWGVINSFAIHDIGKLAKEMK